jgi:hypothetical protein
MYDCTVNAIHMIGSLHILIRLRQIKDSAKMQSPI